ncbi:hypothetical protein Taro_030258 [Colocasia esculenta]|uniref:Uncharacterized protein n=1 Tax=Colocasia esculenta TaxID=4460 RepID=A0A843VRF7_COLES|nr:hypothetical protein [Colocasia esculenta]
MAAFAKLEDSPMFRKQVSSLEKGTDELKERCQKLHKGCPVPALKLQQTDKLCFLAPELEIQDDSLAVGDVAGVRIYAEAPPVNSWDTVEAEAPRSPSYCGGGVGAATLCLAPTKDASWAFYDYDVRQEASSVDTAGSLDVENRAMVLWAGHGSEVFSQQGFEQVVPLAELDCAAEQWSDDLIKQWHLSVSGEPVRTSLGEGCDGDTAFADSLEAFGAGLDDPMSVSIGGPVMSKFTVAFRELSSYKELLRSQVSR